MLRQKLRHECPYPAPGQGDKKRRPNAYSHRDDIGHGDNVETAILLDGGLGYGTGRLKQYDRCQRHHDRLEARFVEKKGSDGRA